MFPELEAVLNRASKMARNAGMYDWARFLSKLANQEDIFSVAVNGLGSGTIAGLPDDVNFSAPDEENEEELYADDDDN